jgi:copper chaperone CopZ
MVYQFLKQKTAVNLVSKTFKASGNCGLCKNRIESALEVRGVNKAEWDMTTGAVTVKFNPKVTNLEELQQLVADAGHDTGLVKASDEVYEQLPACCHYRGRA